MVHYFICFTLNFLEFISYLMTVFTTNKVIMLKDTMHYTKKFSNSSKLAKWCFIFLHKKQWKTKNGV